MRKVILSLGIILIIMFGLYSKTFAASLQATLEITPDKTEVQAGEGVSFNVKIKDIQNAADDKVTAAEGYITYNSNFYETVNEDDCTAVVINSETGQFNMVFSASSSSSKDIGIIKLKVKSNPTGTGNVEFTKLTASDGEEITEEASKNCIITLKQNQETGNNEPKDENQQQGTNEPKDGNQQQTNEFNKEKDEKQNNNKDNEKTIDKDKIVTIQSDSDNSKSSNEDNTIANKIMPKTGVTVTLVVIIGVVAATSILMYKKYDKYKSI